MGWIVTPPPHSYIEVLAPQHLKMCLYLEIRPLEIFRTLMRPLGGLNLIWLVSFLIRRGTLDTHTHTEGGPWEDWKKPSTGQGI